MRHIIHYENQKALEEIYFHDCVYEGFAYDYPSREVRFDLVHRWMGKRYSLCFRNVVALENQGCGFWGGGNAVYHIWIDDDPAYFRRLENIQAENGENYRYSRLDQGIRYISVIMQLNSGDELKLTCEAVEVAEQNL